MVNVDDVRAVIRARGRLVSAGGAPLPLGVSPTVTPELASALEARPAVTASGVARVVGSRADARVVARELWSALRSSSDGLVDRWFNRPLGRPLARALVWTPDSKALFYTAADKKLYSYAVADGKTSVVASSDLGRIGSVSISPDSKWVMFSKQDRTLRSHAYIAPVAGGEERHISDDGTHYSENNAVWTADGRYIVFTSTESTPTGIASQGGINSTTSLWVTALRDQEHALAAANGQITFETNLVYVPAERGESRDARRLGLKIFQAEVSRR